MLRRIQVRHEDLFSACCWTGSFKFMVFECEEIRAEDKLFVVITFEILLHAFYGRFPVPFPFTISRNLAIVFLENLSVRVSVKRKALTPNKGFPSTTPLAFFHSPVNGMS